MLILDSVRRKYGDLFGVNVERAVRSRERIIAADSCDGRFVQLRVSGVTLVDRGECLAFVRPLLYVEVRKTNSIANAFRNEQRGGQQEKQRMREPRLTSPCERQDEQSEYGECRRNRRMVRIEPRHAMFNNKKGSKGETCQRNPCKFSAPPKFGPADRKQ